jgi:hypothetical protein
MRPAAVAKHTQRSRCLRRGPLRSRRHRHATSPHAVGLEEQESAKSREPVNQWKFVRIRSNEEDERMPENLDCTTHQAMRKLAVLPERRGWMLIAATEGPTTEEELNPRWHTRDVRKRTDARGWTLEASNLAPGTTSGQLQSARCRKRMREFSIAFDVSLPSFFCNPRLAPAHSGCSPKDVSSLHHEYRISH